MLSSDYELSILIPSRNEEWLYQTVQDILKNKRAKTEILVGLDGQWSEPPIEEHEDVRVLYVPESIGQRAMQNRLASMSKAKYVMKVDAHCAFDEGFDQKMLDAFKETGDDVTMVPLMKNLHVFDWKCHNCGLRTYMGPAITECSQCGKGDKIGKKLVFKPKHRTPNSTSYRFDKNLQFWYFDGYKKYQEGDLVESMSLQGSCFMCTRENYWDKELCDESWGSWGQQGTEVALKTWLSGGRVICNKRTWYAHMFRTQPGFSFPYPQSGSGQHNARKISQDIFFNNKWHKQIKPLSWLLERFWTALMEEPKDSSHWHGWTDERLAELKKVPCKKA